MDALKLPTDNLYKFLAIGGLLAVITAIYFWHQIELEGREKIDKLEREIAATLDDFHRRFSSPHMEGKGEDMSKHIPLGETLDWSIWAAGDVESRKRIVDHLNMHDEQLHNLSWIPTEQHKDIRKFWCEWFELTDVQIGALVADAQSAKPSQNNLVLVTMSNVSDFRPTFRNSLRLCNQIWETGDDLSLIAGTAGVGVIGGLIVATLGFVCWYLQVQRYQDKLLVLQLVQAQR